jgi:hypothetical protein
MLGKGHRRGMANNDCRYLLMGMLMRRKYTDGMDI